MKRKENVPEGIDFDEFFKSRGGPGTGTGIGVNCFNISSNSFALSLSPYPVLSRAKIASNSVEASSTCSGFINFLGLLILEEREFNARDRALRATLLISSTSEVFSRCR